MASVLPREHKKMRLNSSLLHVYFFFILLWPHIYVLGNAVTWLTQINVPIKYYIARFVRPMIYNTWFKLDWAHPTMISIRKCGWGGGHRESGKQHVWVLVSTDRAVAEAIAQQHSCTTNSSDCERKKVLLQAALTAAVHFWMYQHNPRGPVSPVVTLCTQVIPCVSTKVETNELACKQIDLHI